MIEPLGERALAFGAALDTRNDVHGHLVQVVVEVAHAREDAPHHPRQVRVGRAAEVAIRR